jgi:hypothetical protein
VWLPKPGQRDRTHRSEYVRVHRTRLARRQPALPPLREATRGVCDRGVERVCQAPDGRHARIMMRTWLQCTPGQVTRAKAAGSGLKSWCLGGGGWPEARGTTGRYALGVMQMPVRGVRQGLPTRPGGCAVRRSGTGLDRGTARAAFSESREGVQ